MKNEIKVNEIMGNNAADNFKGLVKTPYCSAAEALNRRLYMQGVLEDIKRLEAELTAIVQDNSKTLPYQTNKQYSKFVNGDLKVLRHAVKELIKAETENELVGE